MSVFYGVWFALAGAIAALTGLSGMRRTQRLRGAGHTAWAMIVPSPADPDESNRGSGRRVSVQFALEDGRVIERMAARPPAGSDELSAGQRVLVWYDPADLSDILVYGRDGRRADVVFLSSGVLLVVAGIAIAALLS